MKDGDVWTKAQERIAQLEDELRRVKDDARLQRARADLAEQSARTAWRLSAALPRRRDDETR